MSTINSQSFHRQVGTIFHTFACQIPKLNFLLLVLMSEVQCDLFNYLLIDKYLNQSS